MKRPFEPVQVTEHVYWVGALDWAVRDFHGYLTSRGSSYNAYLIVADKMTLIDTVKSGFEHEMLSRVAAVTDPRDIAYIVSNHSEMDHSGSLPQVIEAVQPERVFASANGVKALEHHFHMDGDIQAVEDCGSLSLGDMDLFFIETRL
ncbi:MAG: FprA family A-type flavoprotein, partial [Armatimonadota bacterium]